MKHRKLRIAWSVAWGVACLALSAACFVLQYLDTSVELVKRGGPGLTSVATYRGKLSLSWEPRMQYRPEWAGQTNHYGFRYNMYSSGHWNVSGPLWIVGVLLAVVAAPLTAMPWLTLRFSMRTLLLVMTLVAALLGLIAWQS